jgi:hypothetical protein
MIGKPELLNSFSTLAYEPGDEVDAFLFSQRDRYCKSKKQSMMMESLSLVLLYTEQLGTN